jgi:hypothetical protein
MQAVHDTENVLYYLEADADGLLVLLLALTANCIIKLSTSVVVK